LTEATTAATRPARVPAERVVVPFEGEGSGVEELSWGQWEIWLAMVAQQSSLPLGGTKRLAPGTTVEEIADELRFLMSRYQSMRTRLSFDGTGRPRQVLSASGEATLSVFDAGDVDPDEVAATVDRQYQETPFAYADEWPVRMAVVRRHGELTHLVVTVCHLVTDGPGGAVMLEEVAARTTTPVDGMQPLAQARWQRSVPGRRHNELALRYWEGLLRSIPPRRFDPSGDERDPRHWEGIFRSRALRSAVHAAVVRTGVDSSAVLLAVFAVALVRVTGINPVVTRPIVSNRFRPGLGRVVANVAQSGLCVLDVAGIELDEAVAVARRGAFAAYKYAYFDPEQMGALVARVAAERGPDFDISCLFNDRREPGPPEPAATPEQIRDALPDTEFHWGRRQREPFERLFLHVDDLGEAVQLKMFIDTAFLSPAQGEALVRGMEAVAVEAALDPTAPTGLEVR